MGKITSPIIEIIPNISNCSPNNHQILHKHNKTFSNKRLSMDRVPYLSDPSLVPRVQKYLETNVDKTYVDINLMADDLQRNYREYARLKRSSFRASVKKAYSIVLQSYGLEDQDNSSSEEDVSDDSAVDESNTFQNNSLNNQLTNMYTRPSIPKPLDENELIDISSDDSQAGENNSYNKTSNGPSTSQKVEQEPILNFQNNDNGKAADKKNEKYTSASNDRGKKRRIDSYAVSAYQAPLKKRKSLATLQEPPVTFKDVGGMDRVLEDLCKLLIHVRHPEVYRQIGITPPRGFLLHGPPGCGKTLLANAIAGEIGVPLLKVAAPELVAGVSGESEERVRELFEHAVCSTPCILFIDEIDAITPNRQNVQKEMERRIVAQLLSCLDDLNQNECGDRVLVIGATNRPDSIDPALRRAGRFDREICLGIPDVQARIQILKILSSKLKLSEDFDYVQLAKYTPGFVGADLMSLTREAAMAAVNRMFNHLKEQHKLNQRIELQKTDEKQKCETESLECNEQNKTDPEIIVDDEICNKADTIVSTENAIVVIDDEASKLSNECLSPVKNGEVNGPVAPDKMAVLPVTTTVEKQLTGNVINQDASPVEPMPVDIVKSTTSLEDLLSLLHDNVPLTQDELQSLYITMDDFNIALKCVQPSAKREGFATVPDVTWNDVGSLRGIREELQMTILAPIQHAEQFRDLGLTTPTGVLLCGPPGCGKTLLAKAIANEAGINFISVKGPELLNMYVGESERAVRVCFERARNSAPCVIFFDELDAICPKRSDTREGGATMRVVNQLLTEMDGIEERRGVFLLAASNRPDIIDPAVLRPGRLDKILFVGLPTASDRVDILRAITKNGSKPCLAPDVDLEVIGNSEKCQGYTGADLAALVREAGIIALKEYMLLGDMQQSIVVTSQHFKQAILKIRPSVPEKDQKHYEKLRKLYAATTDNDVEEMEYSLFNNN